MSHPVTPMYQCDKPPPDENDLNLIIINIQNLKVTFQFNYFDNTELISFSSASWLNVGWIPGFLGLLTK